MHAPDRSVLLLIISIYEKIELSLVLSEWSKRAIGHFPYWKIERHPTVDCSQLCRVAVTVAVAFYLHKLFGWPGFCILATHTFGAIPHTHFTYTHLKKMMSNLENFSALRAPFFLSNQ